MEDPHTLVLLVIPAYEQLITNRAAQLVQRFHKEENTIGVLTMVDKSADLRFPDYPYYELQNKLNGDYFRYICSKGYIAVKVGIKNALYLKNNLPLENRDTDLRLMAQDLGEAANSENAWFDDNLPGLRAKGKASSEVGSKY
jgi:hypothetical protein